MLGPWRDPKKGATHQLTMIGGSLDTSWGRKHAADVLSRTTAWLDAERRAGRWQILVANDVACLAQVGHFPELQAVAERVLRGAPASAFSAGVITNIPGADFVQRQMPAADEALAKYPEYVRDVVLDYVSACGSGAPQIQLVLDGQLDEAWTAAKTELAKEEHAATLGVLGHIDQALACIRRPEFPATRKVGPSMVVCVESFRRGGLSQAGALLEEHLPRERTTGWSAIHIAAGLLGRIPWGGYPYPDY